MALLFGPVAGYAQGRAAADFVLTKITKNLVTMPQFTYSGGEQFPVNQRDRWLEVEAEFSAAPEFTDDLTFKYFILISGKLLTGEVTHTNVAAGRENHSVMYVSPRTLMRLLGNRPVAPNAIQNIAVQIVERGAVKSELSLERAAPQWFAASPQVGGFVLNKNETPFAPLYWDRYEQIKATVR
ncbi:MAG: Amuc_1102 family pilus-like protein [Chthoniobacterales bacterium]